MDQTACSKIAIPAASGCLQRGWRNRRIAPTVCGSAITELPPVERKQESKDSRICWTMWIKLTWLYSRVLWNIWHMDGWFSNGVSPQTQCVRLKEQRLLLPRLEDSDWREPVYCSWVSTQLFYPAIQVRWHFMFFITTSSGLQVPVWHPAVFLLQPSKLQTTLFILLGCKLNVCYLQFLWKAIEYPHWTLQKKTPAIELIAGIKCTVIVNVQSY